MKKNYNFGVVKLHLKFNSFPTRFVPQEGMKLSMKIAHAKTLGAVERERERERESYTLNKKSAVLLANLIQQLNKKLKRKYKRKIAINLL